MERRWLAVTALVALGPQGCAFIQDEIAAQGGPGHGTGGSSTASTGGSGGFDSGEAGTSGAGGNDVRDAGLPDSARSDTSYVRFANFITPTGRDFCLRPHDPANADPFTIGPVLSSRGVVGGLAFGSVTEYLAVASGQYDVRFVSAGAADCATRLDPTPQGQDLTNLPPLPNGTSWSFVLLGFGNNETALHAFQDERAAVDGRALLRFVNTESVPSFSLDFGFGADTAFTPLFTNVPRVGVGSGPGVDALGYAALDPVSAATAVIRHTGGTGDVSRLAGVDLPAGAVKTAFSGNGVGGPIFLCDDAADDEGPVVSCQFAR